MVTPYYADMHTHTTCSDGLRSPSELLDKAAAKGFKAIAITDHDNMEAHRILAKGQVSAGLFLVPGIELSCSENGREVHILGYFLNAEHADLLAHEHTARTDRERRGQEMINNLRRAGVDVSYAELAEQAGSAPITRPHLAAILVRKGHARNMADAFTKWLEKGRIGYAERTKFSVRDAVSLIRTCGGVSLIAHPGRTYQDPRLFLSLLSLGIDGIEVFHPSHWNVTREYYRMLAIQHHLLLSGGSDYHGSREYDEQNFGTYGISEEQFDAIHTKAVQRRLHG